MTVQAKLLIPGEAGDQVVLPVTGGSPGASTDEHSPETEAEAPRPVQIVERHQIVLGELPQPIEVEPSWVNNRSTRMMN